MEITKKCLLDTGRSRRIFYISSNDNDFCEELNSKLANSLLEKAAASETVLKCTRPFVLLDPSVTYFDNCIISIKYDLFVYDGEYIVYHKRFSLNLLYELGIILPKKYLGAKVRFLKGDCYLKAADDSIFAIPIQRNVKAGTGHMRHRELDAYCDGKPVSVALKIPEYLNSESVDKVRKRLKKQKS